LDVQEPPDIAFLAKIKRAIGADRKSRNATNVTDVRPLMEQMAGLNDFSHLAGG
jgi:hypothetical protein